jgi:hypothetical protein
VAGVFSVWLHFLFLSHHRISENPKEVQHQIKKLLTLHLERKIVNEGSNLIRKFIRIIFIQI